jgi:hypothetical protein
LKALQELYRIYDEFAGTMEVACRKQCATCCTGKVVVTTIDAGRGVSEIVLFMSFFCQILNSNRCINLGK